MQVSEVHEKVLGNGINNRDAENQLGPGFWEVLLNAESDGDIVRKRKGYQQFGGYLPFRVRSIEYTNDRVCFNLDTYVDLSRIRTSPIVVKGTAYGTPASGFDFNDAEYSEQYYPEFTITLFESLTSVGTLNDPKYQYTVTPEEHGHNSWIQHVDTYESTSFSNLSNQQVYSDTEITASADAETTTGLSETNVFLNQSSNYVHATIDASELGASHYYPTSGGLPQMQIRTLPGSDPFTMSFDVAATDLQSTNIIVTVYEQTSTDVVSKVIPDDLIINGTDVEISILNSDPGPGTQDYFYVATAVPDSNVIAGQISSTVESVVIPNVTPYTAYAVYTVENDIRTLVIADSAVYDDETAELTISFQTNESLNYQIYYLPQTRRVNQLCVDRNETAALAAGTTTSIELDVYGIDPLEVVEQVDRNHWLTHIDTYRSVGGSDLLTGVAGVPYKLNATGLATLYPRYKQVLEQSQYLTPFFQNTGTTFTLTGRGYITCTNGSSGPTIDTIEYQSLTGYVRFTLSVPGLSIANLDVGGSEPSSFTDNLDGTYTSALDNDLLTVENTGYRVMNGSHSIQSFTVDTNNSTIVIDCLLPEVTNSDYDETDVGGYAQIYTSPLTISNSLKVDNTFGPGSTITVAGTQYAVRGNSFSSDEKLFLNNVIDSIELSLGLFILGENTSNVQPVRVGASADTGEYVKGDMVQYTGLDRWTKIEDIIVVDSQTITLSGNILTLSTNIATNFEEGQNLYIITEGLEGGVVTVTAIPSTSTLELDTAFTATSGRLIGKTIALDESLTVSDTVNNALGFSPTGRWDAVEKPSVPDSFDDNDRVVLYPFDAFLTTQQEFIQSTMVGDNLYMTNGEDPLIKYDGTNVSRAGLFRWEGAAFVRKLVSTGGAIPYVGTTVAGAPDATQRRFEVTTAGQELVFTVGEKVLTDTGVTTTIKDIITNTNDIIVTDNIPGAASLTSSSEIKYYFRLNIIDANDNIIGSAASGSSNDYTLQLDDSTTVSIKLSKPPKLNLFDYNRLEYEIYRTKQGGAIFFKVASISVPYDNTDDFVHYTDTTANTLLSEADVLSVSTVGAELATSIDEPLRAKYVTSANNRLVLGNLKTSPRFDVKIFRPSTELTSADLNGLTFTFANDDTSVDYKFTTTAGTAVTAIDSSGNLTGGPTLTIGHWVYLYKTTNSDGASEPLGWFKAIGSNQIDYNGTSYALTNVNAIQATAANEIPIFAGAEFSDNAAAYQDINTTGSTQLTIPTKLLNAIISTQFKLNSLKLATEGRTDNPELGRFAIKSLDNREFTLSITGTTLFNVSSVFVNNIKASSGDVFESKVTNYASRLLVSFQNFPEIFDRPRAVIPEDSLSVIDVNSADGQEITGIIPFFGESTTQDSRKQDIVICFKENSIYAINITTRQITKIDSRGIGCNAPRSIAAVPNGIIFASRSGIYRLNRSFDLIWVGRYLDRLWKDNTNLDRLDLATGHVYTTEQEYRLSVPVVSSETATEVYNYEYGDEVQGQTGGWSQFNNIPSTGWASDGTESYFGSTKGRMYMIRNHGTDSDYRDDSSPVEWDVIYRAMDFGAPGKRKIVRAIVSHFRVLKNDSSTIMDIGVDLTDEFVPTSSFALQVSEEDGLSTIVTSKVKSVRQNVGSQKGIYFQVRYRNAEIDTPVSLCGITFIVAGLSHTGIVQASET